MIKRIALLIVLLLVVSACDAVGTPTGSASDSTSAQSVMPAIADYQSIEATSIQAALTTAGVGGSLASGNPIAAGAITRIDQMITCYQSVGAVSARVYVRINPMTAGALAVVNEDRLAENLLACAVNPTGARAQTADQPCGGSGRFTYQGNNYSYVYGASSQDLCNAFVTHFNAFQGR
ncbi:MAG TPA: hypothetical protein PKX07_02500 [Aggregatilineales bacterium]|jgi:hypothetical protein|nr:hypothetical protein [Aggregatilineales bacterium]